MLPARLLAALDALLSSLSAELPTPAPLYDETASLADRTVGAGVRARTGCGWMAG